MINIHKSLTTALLAVLIIAFSLAPATDAQIWDEDDFIISGFLSGTVAVFDRDLTFKGYLDPNFSQVTGMDLTGKGNLVAASYEQEVREYTPLGDLVSNFSHQNLGYPLDIKWQPAQSAPTPGGTPPETMLVGTMNPELAVQEFDLDGECVRGVGAGEFIGLARLPNGLLLVGGFGPDLEFYNLKTGAHVATIPLDNGQMSAVSMFYSKASGTVLMSDWVSAKIYERKLNGGFIRSFEHPSLEGPIGVTRGPNGMVYVADHKSHRVLQFNATGDFLGATMVAPYVNRPTGLLWGGNKPAGTSPPGGLDGRPGKTSRVQ